jgi:hypothetical protein
MLGCIRGGAALTEPPARGVKTMKSLLMVCLLILASGALTPAAANEPKPEVLGVELGMSADEARARLRKMGRLEKEERKQQEVWALDRDERFSHLIVGFEKESGRVRYVTAKARPAGRRVRYSDVFDLKGAKQVVSPPKYEYVREVAARGKHPRYAVILLGSDPQTLTYYSVKKLD